jgi:2-polyprenyl-3-methyl-5-hydroxy-6-metoxy-1,4-benzoquinol methylase
MAASIDTEPPFRILVGIASYGTNNDRYLRQIIRQYRSMPFEIDIVVISNIEKDLGADIECVIGLPNKNPWSLPFAHKKLFVERANSYDLFIYSEDDILITEQTIRAWLNVTAELFPNEVAGFLRTEFGSDGEVNYPDAHAHFHWDPSSVRRRGAYTLTHFTNEHAACYVLNHAQLSAALRSGGFDVAPHEGRYDLLCTAATDPYTQCGLTKLIPVSHLGEFTVHHMSNRYVGKMGVSAVEFGRQIDALLRIAENDLPPKTLIPTETRLWRNAYSKDYYEPITEQLASLIPSAARSVLSVGCGSGAIERWLVKKGLRVAAIPLDPVIASGAAADGVEVFYEDLDEVELNDKEPFDCILCSNILHLAPKPEKLLSVFHKFMHRNSTLIIQSPNMMSLRALRRHAREVARLAKGRGFQSVGAHFSSLQTVRNWCTSAGFQTEQEVSILAADGRGSLGITPAVSEYLPEVLLFPLGVSVVVTAVKRQINRRAVA